MGCRFFYYLKYDNIYFRRKNMDEFKLESKFKPTGDQPNAINQLVEGLNSGKKLQTLLGVTGSRKNFYNSKCY